MQEGVRCPIDAIEKVEQFGHGGQANVWKIKCPDGRFYALKELINLKRVSRFEYEITTTNKLKHKYIIPIHDSYLNYPEYKISNRKKPYYIMPIADTNLQQLIEERHFYNDIQGAIRFLTMVSKGIAYTHSKEISHRDLKPANILILYDGDDISPLICDFGLAKDLTQDIHETKTHEQIGSRFYMAPELAQGRCEGDSRPADIYTLGKILWVLLSGEKYPFDREEHRSSKYDLLKLRGGDTRFVFVNLLLDHMIVTDPMIRIDIETFLSRLSDLKTLFGSDKQITTTPIRKAIENIALKYSPVGSAEIMTSNKAQSMEGEIVKIIENEFENYQPLIDDLIPIVKDDFSIGIVGRGRYGGLKGFFPNTFYELGLVEKHIDTHQSFFWEGRSVRIFPKEQVQNKYSDIWGCVELVIFEQSMFLIAGVVVRNFTHKGSSVSYDLNKQPYFKKTAYVEQLQLDEGTKLQECIKEAVELQVTETIKSFNKMIS